MFIFVLEVLLAKVQNKKEITGLKLNKYNYKYRAFADDVLFIVESPLNILPKILDELLVFGELVGFYLNYKKTKILCKNMTYKEQKTTGSN